MNSPNPSPFEDRLQSTPVRGLPPDLRHQCLQQAMQAHAVPRSKVRRLLAGLITAFLPRPSVGWVWAAAWCLCFLLHWTQPSTTLVAGPDAEMHDLILDPVTRQLLAEQRNQRNPTQLTEPTLPSPDADRPRPRNDFTNRIA